jgi:predicted anti-sigma-YlaC factor YlaD
MFGKKLSEYVQFERWILILIAIAFVVRLSLSVGGTSIGVTRWVSINIVLLLGLLYCSVAVHTRGFGGYKHLFGLLLVQTVLAHMLIALGIIIGIVTGTDNIYTLPEFFGGSNGRNWVHVGIHVIVGFILPLFGWLFGSAILFITKRLKRAVVTTLAVLLISACARTSPELQVIHEAANALGGVERIQHVKTLNIDGEGIAPNLGQNLTPETDLPIWKMNEYRRAIDLTNDRMRVKQVRTAQFLFAGASVQQLDQGIDGDVGYNMGQDGMPARTSESVVRERRIEMLHHPVTLLRAALDPTAKLGNLRKITGLDRVDVTTAKGDTLTLDIDGATKLPIRVTSMSYNANLGDVEIETSFADYEVVGGLKMPKRLTTKIDKYPQFDLQIKRTAVDGDVGDVVAPSGVRSLSLPPAAAVTVTAEPVGKGIWWLAGSGNHRSILFEFDDHLVLFEAPLNETRTKAVIDTARSLRPEKPLTQVIVSHHHFDHSGGLRMAVAEGLTVITYRGNVELFTELVARKHSIVQDALARNPKPLKIMPVDDELTLKDASMEVRLYHLKDNPREGTNLFAYVPRDRILVQADMYDSTWMRHPWGDNLPFNLALRKLQVDKDVPVHGAIQTYADVLKTIESKKAPAN